MSLALNSALDDCSDDWSVNLHHLCLSGSLMYLNEATLLNNIRVRYSKDKIYVSATAEPLTVSSSSWWH